jgi:hypothetical protein
MAANQPQGVSKESYVLSKCKFRDNSDCGRRQCVVPGRQYQANNEVSGCGAHCPMELAVARGMGKLDGL